MLANTRFDVARAEDGRVGRSVVEHDIAEICKATTDASERERCASLQKNFVAWDPDALTSTLTDMMTAEDALLVARRATLADAKTRSARVLDLTAGAFMLTFAAFAFLRHKQRVAFARQAALLESVVETSGVSVVAVDASGATLIANDAARALFPSVRPGVVEPAVVSARAGTVRAMQVGGVERLVRVAARNVSGDVTVRLFRDVTDDVRRADELAALACTDALTGLANRRGFTMLAEQHMRLAARKRVPFTILFADLDDLKRINDEEGHDAGDAAIRSVAEIFRSTLRESDIVARLAGDEFVVLVADTDARGLDVVRRRIARAFAKHNAEHGAHLQCSIGSASFDPSAPEPLADLVANADKRMYAAKRERKGSGKIFVGRPGLEPGAYGLKVRSSTD